MKKTTEELNEAFAAKEEIAQRCHELDMQVSICETIYRGQAKGPMWIKNNICSFIMG